MDLNMRAKASQIDVEIFRREVFDYKLTGLTA